MWAKIKNWYYKSWLYKGDVYAIHLRSGSVIIVDRVYDMTWEYGRSDGRILSLTVNQSTKARTKLLVSTLQLDQIDAITIER